MSADIWTMENDETLIEFVKDHEALYNMKCRDYRKPQLKQNLWSDIGTVLEKSGSECCKRWSYIRDYYIRRRGKALIGSGGEGAKKRAELLTFLDNNSSSDQTTIYNTFGYESDVMDDLQLKIEEPEIQIEVSESTTRFYPEECSNESDCKNYNVVRDEKKKRKITHTEEQLQILKEIDQRKPSETELDEVDLFFNYMAKIVRKLPRYEQVQLRMQISSLVGNAELRSISKESKPTSESTPSSTPSTNTS